MALSPALLASIKGAKNKYSRSQNNSVKIKEGKTTVRILPGDPAVNNGKFWAELGVHWIKTEKNGKPVAVVGCHDEVYDRECPVCTMISKAMATAVDDESIAIIKEWKTKRTSLFNAIIRDGADKSDDPQILELTGGATGNLLGIIAEYDAADVNILDLTEGMDFVIERKGKGFDTEYTVMPAPKSKPLDKKVMDKVHDLQAFIEKEFFRGDEAKAINAISQMTGVPALGLAAPRGTALLTSKAGTVAEPPASKAVEDVEDPAAAIAAAKAAKLAAARKAATAAAAAAAAAAADELALLEAEDDPLGLDTPEEPAAPVAPKKAAAPAKPAAVVKAAAKPAEEFGEALNEGEIDSLLGELDDL